MAWSIIRTTRLSYGAQFASFVALGMFIVVCACDVARADRPVKSLLEIRRQHVMIQHWDFSCGAAALGTLLRYQFGEDVTERQIAAGLMTRGEYVRNPQLVQRREGFSLLDLKRYVQRFRAEVVTKKVHVSKRRTGKRVSHELSVGRAASPRHHKRTTISLKQTISAYRGEGLGELSIEDLVQHAPIMVPINAEGYNHFVVFRGVLGDRVLLADPAWGNRTMTLDKFRHMWINYGSPVGRVGFVVTRADGRKIPNRLKPTPDEFVMLQ